MEPNLKIVYHYNLYTEQKSTTSICWTTAFEEKDGWGEEGENQVTIRPFQRMPMSSTVSSSQSKRE